MSEYEDFEPINEINKIIQSEDIQALPSIYEKKEKTNVVTEGTALVASANKKTLPNRRVGRFEMLEVLERSLSRTVLNFNNPSQRAFTAMRELSDFVNMATTGATPKIADAHRDLLPVGHPLSTKKHNFSQEELAYARAEWMSADPRIAEEFRPMVATAFVTPADSVEREYLIAKLEATDATLVPRDVILGLTAGGDPYGGGNSFLARSTRARAQRRDRKGRFAWMGGGAKVWLGELFNAVSSLFRFAGYNSKTDSFDLEGIPGSPYFGKIVSVPASKVEAVKAILPEIPGLALPKSKSVSKNLIVDPASLVVKDAPTGWTKVSSENGVDTFRSADGWVATRYPNLASAPNEPSITRVRGVNDDKSINPDLPVYHIAKGSSDGLITDKPFAITQGWGDAQALIARYDKKITSSGKRKKASKSAQQKFIKGWTKGEGGYIPGKWNSYTEASDTAGGKDFYTDPSGRYVVVKLATKQEDIRDWMPDREGIIKRSDERTRKQVLDSGLPIHTFDGAKDWDGNVDNLYRLERVKSDGRRELLGFYQDLEDIERDTEIPLTEDKSQDFYESVIADTIQNGGNTIDFVDGSWPEDGYIVAHEADIPQQGGTLAKREELVTPEDFADPIEGPKKLRAFVLKNQDKLSQQGFYLGTWLDTVDVTDENGKVVDQREMVFLDVSEYEPNFDKAFDKAEARSELAYYGVSEGRSFYVKDEKHRREVVRKTPVFDEAKEKRVRAEADKIIKEEDKWFSDNNLELQRTRVSFWKGSGDDAIPNPELQKDYPEIYRRLTRRFEAEKSRGSVFREYIRSVFQMSDGMDPGGRHDGLSGELLRTRDNYVGNDRKTLEMNKALRDGGDVTSKVQKIDALVNKSKLKDDTQFFRGAWLDPELVKDMEVGDMFYDRAFQSMGLEEDTASSYLDFREEASPGKSRVIFRLLLPKGMNAIHVGDDEVIGRRNTKMRIIRKSKLDGTTYFDVDVEPQTKEEINARIQGRVAKPEESKDGASSSELPANDGGGADGLGDGGTLPINYGPKPTGQRQNNRELESFDPNDPVPAAPRNAGGMTTGTWWAWEKGPDGQQYIDYMRQVACRLTGLPVPETQFDKGRGLHFMLSRGWGAPNEKSIAGMVNAIADGPAQPTLFRGLGISDVEGDASLLGKQVGDTIDMPLASFTRSAGVATWYANDRSRTSGTPVIIKVQQGANGVSLSAKSSYYPMDYETVVNGKFEVVSTEDVTMPFWDRSYVTFHSGNTQAGEPVDLDPIIARREFDIPPEVLVKVREALKANPDADLSEFGSDTIRFTNDRRQYDRQLSVSVWKLSEPKTFKVLELKQVEPLRIKTNNSDGTEQSDSTLLMGPISQNPAPTLSLNNSPKLMGERPEQATRIADPEEAIWDRALIDIGIRDEVIDETIRTQDNLENVTRQALKDHVSLEIRKKLKGVSDKEFVELMTQGLANNLTVEDFGFEGTRNIDFIGVVDIDGNSNRTRGLYTSIGRLISSSGGVPRNFPKDLADRLKTGKITRKDAEEVVRLLNEFRATPPFVDNGKLHIPSVDDKDFMEYLRYRTVSNLISTWAQSSNGTNPLSLAIQSVAEKEFGVKGTAEWDMPIGVANEVKDIAKKNENILRKFLRAQYDLTQEYFQKKGISKITLYRGIKEFIRHDIKDATFPSENGFMASIKLRPLSSWSTSMGVANRFRNIQSGKMFRKEFDVKDIFSLPSTGVGCFPEKEIVVLGGLTKDVDISGEYKVDQPRAVFPSPEPRPITYKEDQPQIQVNNAPIDLSRIPPDDGGEEPELDIFDLEGVNPFYADAGIQKQQVARNIADSDEMVEVSDSEMVELSDWFNLFSTDELEWGDDGKRAVGSIRLLALDNGEWSGDYDFSDLLSSVEENIKFGGVEPFKKGSVLERVVNGYINQEDPSISKEELAKFFEEYNEHFDVDYSDSYLVPDIENQQFMNLLREEIASNLIHVWAETSNGDHPMSHAIQEIASDILGVDSPAEWDEGKTQDEKDTLFNSILDIRENYGEALKAFVKAQYRITQEWFEERGIKELVVYRGVTNPIGEDKKSGTVRLRPLSSWSQRLDTALKFTGGTPNRNGTVFKSVVDVKDIFSTPFTGFGCLEEEEIVVLGGKKQVDARPVKDVWGGFWKDEPQVAINNAPIDNAPKPMSNTERKRLEREKRKAEEAAAPSPEEAKQQMEQGRQNLSEVAQTIPENIDTFFDPNNPLNILNARNITNEITGTDGNKDNLTQDQILREKVLFMEPTKEWYDLLDKVEQSGTPFAKEIISRVKKDHARLVEKVRKGSLDERQAQIAYNNSIRDLHGVVNNLVANALANPNSVPNMNLSVSLLMRELDSYFSGNPGNISLSDNTTLLEMALLSLYDTTDGDVASRNPNFNQGKFNKLALDLVSRFRSAYTMYGSSSQTPNRNALTKEIQKIYIENFFGGVNPTDISNTLRRMARLYNSNSVPSLIPNDAARVLSNKQRIFEADYDRLFLINQELGADKSELAKKISNATKQVLSENGLEFNHGVELSANDLNWDGVSNLTQNMTYDPTTGKRRIALQQVPDSLKAKMASELRNRSEVLDIINEALQAYPKPVALAIRNFLIDNKSSFSFASGTRGATALLNLNSPLKAHDIGDITLDDVIKGMSLAGKDKEGAIETTIHEMVHLVVNGLFRNQMNAIAWAKQSKETNNVAPDGKIFHNFVDGNYGDVAYPPNRDYLALEDVVRMIQSNELGAASSNYANPYIGKYGTSGGANVALGQSPFSHGELLSTLLESLLGGGVSGMFSTYANPKKVLSGTNPDGTPKYTTMDDSVFSESMIPFGVSMIVLLNELAKTKLGIA
jgi:hypothetical protein